MVVIRFLAVPLLVALSHGSEPALSADINYLVVMESIQVKI